jgi:hypothetical protein
VKQGIPSIYSSHLCTTFTIATISGRIRRWQPLPWRHYERQVIGNLRLTCVHQTETVLPDDLCEIVDAWDHLPNAVKAGIVAMVKAARSTQAGSKWLLLPQDYL